MLLYAGRRLLAAIPLLLVVPLLRPSLSTSSSPAFGIDATAVGPIADVSIESVYEPPVTS